MYRSLLVSSLAVLTLVATATACHDDELVAHTETTASAGPADAVNAEAPVDRLESMLLTTEDLPPTWRQGDSLNDMQAAKSTDVCAGTSLSPDVADRLGVDTGVQFQTTDGSYGRIMEQLTAGEPEQLASDLDAFRTAVQTCIVASGGVAPKNPGEVALLDFALPPMGDQSFGFVGTALETKMGPTWYVRTGVVRVGSVAVALGITDVLESPNDAMSMSNDEFTRLLQTAVDHITR